MSPDRTLFDPVPLARQHDPMTSKAAAASAESVQHAHESLILHALARIGSGTKDEIARACGLDSVAVARRMRRMQRQGSVRDSGRIGRTEMNRPAIIWEAT